MTLNTIRQRRLAQMAPATLPKGKLNIVLPLSTHTAQRAHRLGHLHLLEASIVRDALKERHGVARAVAGPRAQHAVRSGAAHAARQRLEALANGDHERALARHAVHPRALRVLRLQPGLPARLQQVRRQHRVLVGADALAGARVVVVVGAGAGHFRVPHDLQLVLLVRVEEPLEGARRQAQRLRHQRCEERAHARHARHVLLEGGPERRQVRR